VTYCGNGEYLVSLGVIYVSGNFPALLGSVDNKLGALEIIILEVSLEAAVADDGVGLCKAGQTEVIVGLGVELAALIYLTADDIGPCSLGNVELGNALVVQDRCNEDIVAEHILLVKCAASGIVSVVDDHCSHHGDTCLVGLDSLCPDVRHQLALELGEEAENVCALGGAVLIEEPGHSVGGVAVKSGMCGEETECCPSLVDVSCCGSLKAGHIVAEEAEA